MQHVPPHFLRRAVSRHYHYKRRAKTALELLIKFDLLVHCTDHYAISHFVELVSANKRERHRKAQRKYVDSKAAVEAEPKSVMISARITATADEKLNKNAKTAKLSKSRYLEQLILGKEVAVIGELDTFVPALKSSGKNLHQILVRPNTGQIFSPDVHEVQQTYSEIFIKLNELAQGYSNGSD